jgi:hypothetical protein
VIARGAVIVVALVATGCGLIPEPSVGLECQRTPPDGREVREGEDPLAEGGPLANLPITEMDAEAVGQEALEQGFGVTYRYMYDVGPQPENGATGYSECWCIPPPDGEVSGAAYDSIGRVVVFVDSTQHRDSVRPQPVQGWGCEGGIPVAS